MEKLETLLHLYQEIQDTPEKDVVEMTSSPEDCAEASPTDGSLEEVQTHLEPYPMAQQLVPETSGVEIALSEWEAARVEELLDRLRTPPAERADALRRIMMLGVQSLEYSSAHFLPLPASSGLDSD